MKILLALALISLPAHAEIFNTEVQCSPAAGFSCADRALSAFTELDCEPVADSVQCHTNTGDPLEYCKIQSLCSESNYGLFGQILCTREQPNLARVDRGLTLTTSVGFPRHWVTKLCK